MDYVGLKCPVCGKAFTKNDDIVVCPQCGAPYHRACYEKAGKCVFEDRHGTSFAWSPPRREAESESETKRCPRCGAPNPSKALFCSHCGQPFSEDGGAAGQQPNGNPRAAGGTPPYGRVPYSGNPAPGGYPPGSGPMPFQFDPMGGVNPKDTIGGVQAVDMAKMVQNNTQYYLPVFVNLDHFRRNRFNFSSFLFPGLWMLYRKQYKAGALLSFLMGAMLFFYLYVWQYFSYPIYLRLLAQIGVSDVGAALTNAQRMQMANLLASLPNQQMLLFMVPFFILLARLVVRLIIGFLANRVYMKYCLGKVHSIHQTCASSAEADIHYQEEGGVNAVLATGLGLCFLFLYFVIFPQVL